MGFLNKAFKKVKKQIQPGNMIARDMGPGNMPRRPDIFGGNSFLFGRKPDMISDMRFRGEMPKRGGGFGNLGEAIRRMQEQGDAPTYSQKRSFSARASTDGRSPLFQPNHLWPTYSSRR
jgi:hypothetical protein